MKVLFGIVLRQSEPVMAPSTPSMARHGSPRKIRLGIDEETLEIRPAGTPSRGRPSPPESWPETRPCGHRNIAKQFQTDYIDCMTFSADFRRHVLSIRDREGLTFQETADRFSVGIASVVRWARQPEPKSGRNGRPRKIDLECLAQDVHERPDDYQIERAARFGVSQNAICQALQKLALTHKKTAAPPKGR